MAYEGKKAICQSGCGMHILKLCKQMNGTMTSSNQHPNQHPFTPSTIVDEPCSMVVGRYSGLHLIPS